LKSQAEIETVVDRVLIKLIGVSAMEVADATRDGTPGWSSLMHIEIFFTLEEEFGLRFDDNAMAFSDSRNDLVQMILNVNVE